MSFRLKMSAFMTFLLGVGTVMQAAGDLATVSLDSSTASDNPIVSILPEPGRNFQGGGLVIGRELAPLDLDVQGWSGREGTLAFCLSPLDWRGDDDHYVMFLEAKTASGSCFHVYKFGQAGNMIVLYDPVRKKRIDLTYASGVSMKDWTPGTWHHLAIAWKQGESLKIYLDGKLYAQCGGEFDGFAPPSQCRIGYRKHIDWKPAQAKTIIRNLVFSRRCMTSTEVAVMARKPAIRQEGDDCIPLATMECTPTLDGTIHDDEYTTAFNGFVDNQVTRLYEHPARIACAQDQQHVYFAATVNLPKGQRPSSVSSQSASPLLIDKGDLFVLFLAHQPKGKASKAFEGIYCTLAPNGAGYCGLETVDWSNGYCSRRPLGQTGIRSKSHVADMAWTVELAIPKHLIAFREEQMFLSMGFTLGGKLLSFSPLIAWFDHPQTMSRLVPAPVAMRMAYDRLELGEAGLEVELQGTSQQKFDSEISVSLPDITRTAERMDYMTKVGETLSVTGERTLWRERRSLAAGSKAVISHQLSENGLYLHAFDVKDEKKTYFRRHLLFKYYPEITLGIANSPTHQQLHVTHRCRRDARSLAESVLRLTVWHKGIRLYGRDVSSAGVIQEGTSRIPTGGMPVGTYDIVAELVDSQGRCSTQAKTTFTKIAVEPWREHPVAMEALKPDWVPFPWTPLSLDDKQARVWGRCYDYGEGIVGQLTSQGVPLLGAPATLHYELEDDRGVRTLRNASVQCRTLGRGRAQIQQRFQDAFLTLQVSHTLEFDGFNLSDFTVIPAAPLRLKRLWIDYPFQNMRFLTVNSREYYGKAISSEFLSFDTVWVGTDTVSCRFIAENCRGWLVDSRKPRLSVDHEGHLTRVRMLVVNTPCLLSKPMEFRWSMEVGPLKPMLPSWRDFRKIGWYYIPNSSANLLSISPYDWSPAYCIPRPWNWRHLHNLVDFTHRHGLKAYPYLTPSTINEYYVFNPNSDYADYPPTKRRPPLIRKKALSQPVAEYHYNAHDWAVFPIRKIGDGSSIETNDMVWIDPGSSYADYYVWSLREILRKSDVDGFYLDLTVPAQDFNAEKGLSYTTLDGVQEGTRRHFAFRDMFKRLYHVFLELRPAERRPYLLLHATPFMNISQFGDVLFYGENVSVPELFDYTKTYMLEGIFRNYGSSISRQVKSSYDFLSYRSVFNHSSGTPMMLLPQYGMCRKNNYWRDDLTREVLALTMVHDTLLWAQNIKNPPVFEFWRRVTIPYGMGESRFHGYWNNGIRTRTEGIRCSYYSKSNRRDYLLVVANFSSRQQRAELALPVALQGLMAENQETGTRIHYSSNLAVTVPAHDLRVIRLTPAKAAASSD